VEAFAERFDLGERRLDQPYGFIGDIVDPGRKVRLQLAKRRDDLPVPLDLGFEDPDMPPAMQATAAIASGDTRGEAQVANRDADDRDSIAPILLRRLDNLMTVERVYRLEGLSIGGLAARLDLPEYRLRQVINEGLGYRNFNAFLNRYRIDDAKAALSDQSQRDVQVLTIAMDAGFQSIGPFNRAFKADTGMTPTEFRRHALNRSQAAASQSDDNFKIGQSR
jgi:AraC-like DNA-binding protein